MSDVRVRRIGHKGADHIAPGNTLASFDAALAHEVDLIEFDVLPEFPDGTGRLLLAHDHRHLREDALTLDEGLAHFAQDAFAGVELNVDLKLPGYEARVIDALRDHGLAERSIISTMEEESLPAVRAAGPEVRLGWSVPKARRDPLGHPVTRVLAIAAVQGLRIQVARACAARLRAGEIDAVMSNWVLVNRWFARQIAGAGGELYVWTVDDAERIRRLEAIPGVTGITTNDPRLFDA